MRRFEAVRFAAALLAGVLIGHPAGAQETMTFRPVPAESVAQVEKAGAAGVNVRATADGRPVKVQIDRNGVTVTSAPEAVAPPAPPARPGADEEDSSGRTHETTGDIVRFGSNVEIPYNQTVNGDVVSMGGNVTVRGSVRGSVTSMGGDVTLAGGSRVNGDVVCMGGTLHEEPGSYVGGQRVTAPRAPGGHMLLPMLAMVSTGVRMIIHIFGLLVALALTFLVVKLAPGRTQTALETIRTEPGNSLLTGLLLWGLLIPSVIALAIVIAILCITIIGIPLAAGVTVGYVAFFILAAIWGGVVGYALMGAMLHSRFKGGVATLMASAIWGVVAVQGLRIVGDLVGVVPLFGFLGGLLRFISFAVSAVLITLGAGALVRAEYRRRTVQDWWTRSRPRRESRGDDFPPPPSPGEPGIPPAPPAAGPGPQTDPSRFQAPQAPQSPQAPEPPPVIG